MVHRGTEDTEFFVYLGGFSLIVRHSKFVIDSTFELLNWSLIHWAFNGHWALFLNAL